MSTKICHFHEEVSPIYVYKVDEDITTINVTLTIIGPITRSYAKKIIDQANANLMLSYKLDEMFVPLFLLVFTELKCKVEGSQQSLSS